MNGYLIKGSRGEYLLVIRDTQIETIRSIVDRLSRMREKEIKNLAKELEFSLGRIDNEQVG